MGNSINRNYEGLPLISVIVPAYNSANRIARALDSALAQSWSATEIIVIDDGSTDETPQIVAEYGDRLRYLRQDNQGAAAARNKGIDLANGSFIAFLDSDDSWVSNKLEFQIEAFKKDPEIALVFCQCKYQNDERYPDHNGLSIPAINQNDIEIYSDFSVLFENPYIGTPSVMMPVELARQLGGFDVGLTTAEDIDFWMRTCWQRKYAKVQQKLVYVAMMEDSLGSGPRTYEDNLMVIDRFCKNFPEFSECYQASVLKQKSYIYNRWIRYLLYHGEGATARRVLKQSREFNIESPNTLLLKSYLSWLNAKLKGRTLPAQP